MEERHGSIRVYIFIGIPLLLLWSFILTLIKVKREGSRGQFLGRTLTFIGGIYYYTISSFIAWFVLIVIAFGIAALVKMGQSSVHYSLVNSVVIWFITFFQD
ncbi:MULTISPECIES: hypothetical protein [Cytobacillus]|uniref:hypothetical protein n=1 Tax=Cytobacillus TaxID=2675230 RepID=UPI00203E7BB7|nr:hypothetical protein [Cytobacillus firmus]MCM3708397.1 hypothetical protein [Cytobacillus firmus]